MDKSTGMAADEPRLCARCSDPLSSTDDGSPTPTAWDHSTAGKLHCDSSKTSYVSNTHWKAVLEGISELKILSQEAEDVADDAPSPEQQREYGLGDSILIPGTVRERPRLLYGWHKPVSLSEILGAMPERIVVDRLVLSYFHNPPIPHCKYRSNVLQQDSFSFFQLIILMLKQYCCIQTAFFDKYVTATYSPC